MVFTMICLFVASAAAQSVLSIYSTSAPVLAHDVHDFLGEKSLSVSTFDLSTGAVPTLLYLRSHTSVFVWGNWGIDALQQEALGNVLADFVDSGGSLTVAMWGFVGATTRIRGRLLSAGMLPVDPVAQVSGSPATMVKLVPSHRLLHNVRAFNGGPNSWRATGTVAVDAVLVAQWSTGEPLVVVTEKFNGTVVVLVLFPPSSTAGFGLWDNTTDGAQLMANAVNFRRSTPSPTSSRDRDPSENFFAVIAVVLALCLLILIVAGVVLWRHFRRSSIANARLSDEKPPRAWHESDDSSQKARHGSGSSDHSLDDSSSLLSVVPAFDE